MKKLNPEIPFYFFLNGDNYNLKSYFDDTKTGDIPYSMLLGEKFIKRGGVRLPAILWVNNSIVENKTQYVILNQQDIENWLKKP